MYAKNARHRRAERNCVAIRRQRPTDRRDCMTPAADDNRARRFNFDSNQFCDKVNYMLRAELSTPATARQIPIGFPRRIKYLIQKLAARASVKCANSNDAVQMAFVVVGGGGGGDDGGTKG